MSAEASKDDVVQSDSGRGVKRSSDAASSDNDTTTIRSVNAWESVELVGDETRKNKFLRLMGANKKEHKGRFVIGEKQAPPTAAVRSARSIEETEKLTDVLEDQYRQGLEFKLSGDARRHKGFGFSGSAETAEGGSEPVVCGPSLPTDMPWGGETGCIEPEDGLTNSSDTKSSGSGDVSSQNVSSVHSVNDWESVELDGDDSRKNKFLRLMGANKKEHKGRFVIGDKQAAAAAPIRSARSNEETEKLTGVLEGQYRQGLEFKLSGDARRHKGFGFSGSSNFVRSETSAEPRTDAGGVMIGPNLPTDTIRGGERLEDTVATNSETERAAPGVSTERFAGIEQPRVESARDSDSSRRGKSNFLGFVKSSSSNE